MLLLFYTYSISLLGLTLSGKFMGSLQNYFINCVFSACSATFICTLHNQIADFTTKINHDLLPSALAAQSAEQRTIKSGGLAFDSRRGWRFFCCLVKFPPIPLSLLGLKLSGKSYTAELIFSDPSFVSTDPSELPHEFNCMK